MDTLWTQQSSWRFKPCHTHTPQRRSQEFVTHKPQNWTDWLVRITRTRQEIACLIKTSKAASQQCLLANLLCETKAVTWRQRQERKAECGAGKKPVESTRAERTPKGFHTSIEEHLKNLRRCEDGLAKWMIPFTLSRFVNRLTEHAKKQQEAAKDSCHY